MAEASRRSLDRRHVAGRQAERRAAAMYRGLGYVIVAQNWRCRFGELDLIAQSARHLVFVEVKSRRTSAFGGPGAALSPAQRERICIAAECFMNAHPSYVTTEGLSIRFDVVLICGPTVERVEGAFLSTAD